MIRKSKIVASAKIASIRAAGFDVVATPGKLPNHGTLFHQSRSAAPFENQSWRDVLSFCFKTETIVP
jgi:hypothetical protein